MPALFDPLIIKNICFRNRIAVSPMCQYSAVDGFANDWHLVHLGSRAAGGAGLLIQEATAVSPEGRITPDCLGLWKDEHMTMLKRIVTFIESQGAVPGIQLAHAGRKASHSSPWMGAKPLLPEEGAWQTISASAVPYKDSDPVPHAMSTADIHQCISDFKAAATRALACGYKVLEIHAAHGYLLNNFLSPVSNHRDDEYGGSFENRIRLLLEVIENVQSTWPAAYPLFVRISATDWVEKEGWTIEDAVALAHILKTKGIDLIDCSSGGNAVHQQIPVAPLYQTPFAERIKKETGIMTGAVGLITAAEEADAIIKEGKADLVIMARQLLRDPYFPLHAAKVLGVDVPWPNQYLRAKR
ncbi:MAG TPA: NADH:flavin oxidoreductase/NADH oxidase [Panacibacter sp.]|nr:NADH:flavin oxidoreductase/NADH oxidase [Panacibacter sp.]HNP44498.1 NADH:flavin oxidoreductase/NADH oxidase [Panacibacter sp.]